MSYNKNIFTDAIKDVIGNESVLDQFDVAYAASFYGTTQDDYVTGTMAKEVFSVSKKNGETSRQFITGTRGRAFSVYYAEDEVPLSETDPKAIAAFPRVSSRLVPPSTQTSYSYRISQLLDESERFYDTCLPSFEQALNVDKAVVWTYTGSFPDVASIPSETPEDDISYLFSPYKKVDTTNVGYMVFNGMEIDRENYDNDPLVNNNWTWSYPYENKYLPNTRFLSQKESLGISKTNYVTNKEFTAVRETRTPTKIDKFFPILPGKNQISGTRNSLRPTSFGIKTGLENEISNVLSYSLLPSSSIVDEAFGYSNLIPSDVNLSEALTGTMTYNDTIKFLYGFGDVNNMTFGAYTFDTSAIEKGSSSTRMYAQPFENIPGRTLFSESLGYPTGSAPPTHAFAWSFFNSYSGWSTSYSKQYTNSAKMLGTESSLTGTISWIHSPVSGGWSLVKSSSTSTDSAGKQWAYLSSTILSSGRTTFVRWPATSSIGTNILDEFVLASGTSRSVFKNPSSDDAIADYIGEGQSSVALLDITSSNPWNFSYSRTIHADPTDKFYTQWEAWPGTPSYLKAEPIIIESLSGTKVSGTSGGISLTNYTGSLSVVYPPGEYRIGFVFEKGTGGTQGDIDRAFVNNLKINKVDLLGTSSLAIPFTSSYILGANNYPQFYGYKVDNRDIDTALFNPIVAEWGQETSEYYKGQIYGISPIIRGWKYGLYSGFPIHSKATFRRNKFGQFRDMLEQRPYSRFVFNETETEPFSNPARPQASISAQGQGARSKNASPNAGPVSVDFVKLVADIDARGIGKIKIEKIKPELTYSQNLSTAATSSQPYFDGLSRLRDW